MVHEPDIAWGSCQTLESRVLMADFIVSGCGHKNDDTWRSVSDSHLRFTNLEQTSDNLGGGL